MYTNRLCRVDNACTCFVVYAVFVYSVQLVEAYATVIECCQLFHLLSLSNYYVEKALSRFVSTFFLYSCTQLCTDNLQSVFSRCSDIQFGLEDLATYVHLLNVALNTKLLLGKIEDALHLGI